MRWLNIRVISSQSLSKRLLNEVVSFSEIEYLVKRFMTGVASDVNVGVELSVIYRCVNQGVNSLFYFKLLKY